MSGHSKWHNIQAKKGKTDAQRAKIFTKMAREIMVVVKEGGANPASNSRLADVIAKAKAANVISLSSMLKRSLNKISLFIYFFSTLIDRVLFMSIIGFARLGGII